MCNLFGGGTTTTQQSSTSNVDNSTGPSSAQLPYTLGALNSATNLYANSPGYTPLAYQSLPTSTLQALTSLSNYGSGAGASGAGALQGVGTGLLPNYGTAAAGATGVLGSSMSDPTMANIADAGAYANNPYTQGMIAAAQTPIERQLNEVSIPGLNVAAAGSGNMDSSRAGTQQAILQRDAGEDEANVASNILGTQYNNGLQLAQTARNQGQNTALGAVGALTGLGNAGAANEQAGDTQMLQDLQAPINSGLAVQSDMNNANQVAYNNANSGAQFPWQMLSNYYGIVGNNPLGTTTTGTTDTSSTGSSTAPGPGILSGLLGTAAGIGSFFAPTGLLGNGPSMASNIANIFKK